MYVVRHPRAQLHGQKLLAVQHEPDRDRDCLSRLPPDHAEPDLAVAGEAVCSKRANNDVGNLGAAQFRGGIQMGETSS